jgi:hypothetical protein
VIAKVSLDPEGCLEGHPVGYPKGCPEGRLKGCPAGRTIKTLAWCHDGHPVAGGQGRLAMVGKGVKNHLIWVDKGVSKGLVGVWHEQSKATGHAIQTYY